MVWNLHVINRSVEDKALTYRAGTICHTRPADHAMQYIRTQVGHRGIGALIECPIAAECTASVKSPDLIWTKRNRIQSYLVELSLELLRRRSVPPCSQ